MFIVIQINHVKYGNTSTNNNKKCLYPEIFFPFGKMFMDSADECIDTISTMILLMNVIPE